MGAEAPEPIAALAFCYVAKRYGLLSGSLHLTTYIHQGVSGYKKNYTFQLLSQHVTLFRC